MPLNNLFWNYETWEVHDTKDQQSEANSRQLGNWENITKSNEKIEINWDNKWNLTTSNGKIVVNWNNFWNCITSNWKIVIDWNNFWMLRTSNWKIDIYWDNTSDVWTSNWKITLDWNNSWELNTTNWRIFIWWKNNWKLTFSNGDLEIIWDDLKISMVNNCSWDIVNSNITIWGNHSGVTITWCNSKVIVNWKVISSWGSYDKKIKVEINNFEIDFDENKVIERSSWQKLDILEEKNDSIYRD